MMTSTRWYHRLWPFGLAALSFGFVAIGILHFVKPEPFVDIVPPFLPEPLLLVYISGVAEIAGGLGVLLPRTRRLAAWDIIALLVAVFPANIYHAVANVEMGGSSMPLAYHIIRLPMQLVLIFWAWIYTRPRPATRRPE